MRKSNYYLITGGMGLIGSNIVKQILKEDKNSIILNLKGWNSKINY